MKRILPLLAALLLTSARAGQVGSVYDIYIYHGSAHKDYQTGGGKNHARTKSYTYAGFATEASLRAGLTILYTGKDPRIVNKFGQNCSGDALAAPFDAGQTRLYESTQIGVVHHDQLRSATSNIVVNCVQKKDANLGDNTHASVGVVAVKRGVLGSAYQPPVVDENTLEVTSNPFQTAMRNYHADHGVSSSMLNWLTAVQVEQAASALFGGVNCGGNIIVSPLFHNQSTVHTVPGEYQTIRVSGLLEHEFCTSSSCGIIEKTGNFVAQNECIQARVRIGDNLHLRLKTDTPVANLRDPAVLVVPQRPGFGYVHDVNGLLEQVFSGTHVTLIEEDGNNAARFSVKVYELPAPQYGYTATNYTPLVRNEQGEDLFPPIATFFVERLDANGESVTMDWAFDGRSEHHHYLWETDIEEEVGLNGWTHIEGQVNGPRRATRRSEQMATHDNEAFMRVIEWNVDPVDSDVILRRVERHYHDVGAGAVGLPFITGKDSSGNPIGSLTTLAALPDWRLHKQIDGFNNNTETTTYTYYTSADGAALAGRVKSIQYEDGNWVRMTYDAQGRSLTEVRSYLNNAFSSADSANRVTTYDYTPLDTDPGTNTTTPRTVTESVAGQVVSKSFTILDTGKTRRIRAASPTSAWNDAANLVTTDFHANGETRVSLSPDGLIRRQVTSYMGDLKIVTSSSGKPASFPVTASTTVAEGSKTVSTSHRDLGYLVSSYSYRITPGGDVLLSGNEVLSRDAEYRATHIAHSDLTDESFTYTCCGLSAEINRDGISTTHDYDELRRRIRSTRAGVTTHTEYDALGRVKFTYQTPSNNYTAILGKATSAPEYNELGELEKTYDPAGRVTTYARSVANGIVTRTTTLPGGATSIDVSYADGTPIETLGTATRAMFSSESWDSNGQRISLRAYTANTNEFSRSISDFLGRTIRSESPSPSGTGLAVTQNVYDPETGRLSKTTFAHSSDLSPLTSTLYFYNDLGEQHLTVVDVNNNGTIDWSGPDRISSSEVSYESDGSDFWHVTRSYIWQANGDPDPTLVSTTETSLDGLISRSTSFGLTTESVTIRNPQSQIRNQTTTAADGSYSVSVSVNGLPQYSARYDADDVQLGRQDYGYDEWNRRNEVIDAGTGTTLYTFHIDGSLQSEIRNPNSAIEQVTTTWSSGLDSLAYTASGGRIEKVTLPDATTVTREYAPTGELHTQYGSRQYPVAYTYDYAGRMATLTTWQDYDPNPANRSGAATTTWTYNNAGSLTAKRYNDNLGPDYEYDVRGLLIKRIWARGISTTYTYANTGELTEVDAFDSSQILIPQSAIRNQYDRMGRVVDTTDASGTRTNSYNAEMQLTTETYNTGLLDGWEIERSYDSLRRPENLELLHSSLVTLHSSFTYDASSRLKTVIGHSITNTYAYATNRPLLSSLDQGGVMGVSYEYDDLNRLTKIETEANSTVLSSHAYLYNLANQRTRATLVDGSYWEYSYDDLGQVTGGIKKDSNGTAIPGYNFGYTFDDIGNRKTFTENSRTTTYNANLLNQYAEITRPAFAHLHGNRGTTGTTIEVDLLGDANPAVEAAYTGLLWYSEMGISNLISQFQITATEGGNSNSQTGSLPTPNGLNEPEFDADGNLLKDHLWEYTWNSENRMVKQEHRDDVNISPLARTKLDYTYDSQGRRVRKTVSRWDNVTEAYIVAEDLRFVYNGWNLIAEIKPDDSLLRSHIWGLDLSGSMQGAGGVGGLLSTRHHDQAITAFPFFDGNGNVMGYSDASTGNVIATHEYDPFGRRIKTTGANAGLFLYRFSTKYECADSGFLYYGYRDLDPETGRWPNRDPIEEEGGDNLYGFVGNDGVNSWDVLGQATSCGPDLSSSSIKVVNNAEQIPLFIEDILGKETGLVTVKTLEFLHRSKGDIPCGERKDGGKVPACHKGHPSVFGGCKCVGDGKYEAFYHGLIWSAIWVADKEVRYMPNIEAVINHERCHRNDANQAMLDAMENITVKTFESLGRCLDSLDQVKTKVINDFNASMEASRDHIGEKWGPKGSCYAVGEFVP